MKVTDLRLGGNDLTGMVPSELGNLVSLGLLEIQGQRFIRQIAFNHGESVGAELPEFWRTGALRSRNAGISSVWLAGVDNVNGEICNP